ncbi:MAG: hypothetical protein IPL40_06800 [Proteobacteria bacterium]|nr:hypothetical protein [Pseudomonadota bacterium]
MVEPRAPRTTIDRRRIGRPKGWPCGARAARAGLLALAVLPLASCPEAPATEPVSSDAASARGDAAGLGGGAGGTDARAQRDARGTLGRDGGADAGTSGCAFSGPCDLGEPCQVGVLGCNGDGSRRCWPHYRADGEGCGSQRSCQQGRCVECAAARSVSPTAFARCKEELYQLPIARQSSGFVGLSYDEVKVGLRANLGSYLHYAGSAWGRIRQTVPEGFFDYAGAPATDPRHLNSSADCYSSQGIRAFGAVKALDRDGKDYYPNRPPVPLEWASISRITTLFYDGYHLTRDDPEPWAAGSPLTLNDVLRQAVVRLADHVIVHANYKGVRPGAGGVAPRTDDWRWLDGVQYLGWNNLAAGWDAWANNSCSPAGEPNLYATGFALLVLADAYSLTGQAHFRMAFDKGAAYWHQDGEAAAVPGADGHLDAPGGPLRRFASSETQDELSAPLKRYPPFAIKRLYTVGGSRFSGEAGDATQLAIRYHYTPRDPGLYTLNCAALLGLALTKMGRLAPTAQLTLDDGHGGSVARSYPNIGHWAMFPIFSNLEALNGSYVDLDSRRYVDNAFEHHLDTTAAMVATAGALLGLPSYTAAARRVLEAFQTELDAALGYGTGGEKRLGDVYCAHRTLSPAFMARCIEVTERSDFNASYFRHLGPAIRQLAE